MMVPCGGDGGGGGARGVLLVVLVLMAVSWVVVQAPPPRCCAPENVDYSWAVSSLVAVDQCPRPTVFLITDGSHRTSLLIQTLRNTTPHLELGLFEVRVSQESANETYALVSQTLATAKQLRETLHCVTVVVLSDDPVFLSTFAESSFKSHLLSVQTTRLLTFTRLPLYRLQTLHHIHKTFSRTNSLLAVTDKPLSALRMTVYSVTPFTELDTHPLQVASWNTKRSLALTSPPKLYPQKFLKFPHRPHIKVGAEQFPSQVAKMVDDPKAPGGKRLTFIGTGDNVMNMMSKAMNFTYSYQRPPDRSWGIRKSDGSWTGMLSLIMRQEVEFSTGPFFLDLTRNTWMDYSTYVSIGGYYILAGRGRPKVDPWGFLLPLSPLVWVVLWSALGGVLTALMMLPSFCPQQVQSSARRDTNMFNCVRVLLQEDVMKTTGWWWWERVVLGVWMLMMVVMSQSYVGNLMSMLAVRNIEQPYQNLGDVLDDSYIGIVLTRNSLIFQYFQRVKSGPFQALKELVGTERVTFTTFTDISRSVETVVRAGTHVIFDVDINFSNILSKSFSLTGNCDFYVSRSSYLTNALGMLAPKNSLLVPGLNKVASALVESGLYNKWIKYSQANSTMCNNPPRIITVNTVLSLTNLWGMFALLGCGFGFSLLIFLLEVWVGLAKGGSGHQQIA